MKDRDKVRLQNGSEKYLKYHRDNIFCKIPNIILGENDIDE